MKPQLTRREQQDKIYDLITEVTQKRVETEQLLNHDLSDDDGQSFYFRRKKLLQLRDKIESMQQQDQDYPADVENVLLSTYCISLLLRDQLSIINECLDDLREFGHWDMYNL